MRYIPPNKFKKWILDTEVEGKLKKESKKLSSIVPNKEDPLQFNQKLIEILKTTFSSP